MHARYWLAISVCSLAVGLQACDNGKKASAFVLNPVDVEDAKSTMLMPGMATVATSTDGRLSLTVPAGAVSAPVAVSIGRLKASSKPEGIVGDVYVLEPAGQTFAAPARLRIDLTGVSGVVNGKTRPVWLDSGTENWNVLGGWTFLSDLSIVAGDITHLSSYAATDGSGNPLASDAPAASIGDEYLALNHLSAANQAYEAAVAANAGDLQAHLGAAVTGLALLAESAPVDDVLTLCGEPLVDVEGQLFSAGGFLAHQFAHRMGDVELTLKRGATASALADAELVPNSSYAEYSEWTDVSAPGNELAVTVRDNKAGASDEQIELSVYVQNHATAWADGASFPVNAIPSGIELSMWVSDGTTSANSTWVRLGTTGTLTVVKAGYGVGDEVRLRLDAVRFEKVEQAPGDPSPTVTEVFEVSGTIVDTVFASFEPADGTVPFKDIQFRDYSAGPPVVSQRSGPVQLIEKCGLSLTVPYLLGKVGELMDGVLAVRGHLDAIVASPAVLGFSWTLPTGAVANQMPIPVGPVEVYALRAALYAAAGANAVVQQYHYLDSPLTSLIADIDPYYGSTTCTSVCDPDCHSECTQPTIVARDVSPAALVPALNSSFLVPIAGLDMLTEVKPLLAAALDSALAGLAAQPTADVLVSFQRNTTAQDAAGEIATLLTTVKASMDSQQALTLSPDWKLHLVSFLTDPFTKQSLLTATGLSDIWSLEARNDTTKTNAAPSIAGDVLDQMAKALLTMPDGPTGTTYCKVDADCGNVDWKCYGFDDLGGVCSTDMTTACSSSSFCSTGYCVQSTCTLGGPTVVDSAKVNPAFDADPPAFINETLWDSLQGAF